MLKIFLTPGMAPTRALQGLHTLLASARPGRAGLLRAARHATRRTSLSKARPVFMTACVCSYLLAPGLSCMKGVLEGI